jgi:hypothetical protein
MVRDRIGGPGTVAPVGRALVAVAVLLLASACSDEEEPEVVTQEVYDEEAERLCGQHREILERAYTETVPDSDAEEAAFYTSDLIPRARALIRRLGEIGFPPERDAEYREALNRALTALADLEAHPYRYIDQRHRGVIAPEDDFINRLREAFADAEVPC